MLKINGVEIEEMVDLTHAYPGDSALIRAACNASFVRRGHAVTDISFNRPVARLTRPIRKRTRATALD